MLKHTPQNDLFLQTNKIEYLISYFENQPNALPPIESIAGWLLEYVVLSYFFETLIISCKLGNQAWIEE